MAKVTVIGAGIVGLACSAKLVQQHHQVTVLDPRPPGEYCSFGNAGCLSRASIVPLGLPGMWKKVPSWLLDTNGPLVIPLRNAPRVARWLWRLHEATSRERVDGIADALQPLLTTTIDKWRPLAQWAGVPELIRQDGYAFLYESHSAFESDTMGRALRQVRGVAINILEGDAIRDFDPVISPRITHMALLPEQGHCPNPLRLSQALASRLQEHGVPFVNQTASGFDMRDGLVVGVRTDAGVVETELVVIAAGAHSHLLSSQLGSNVLLETERGYHIMLQEPDRMPRIPIMSGEGKFFLTPMETGLRVAGTVELAGLNAQPNYKRADDLLQRAKMIVPEVQWKQTSKWMGHRPSLPDSKPVIGRAPNVPNALFAFGHGHVGLTAAAPTAEIIADLAMGRKPGIDIRPFAADRAEIRA